MGLFTGFMGDKLAFEETNDELRLVDRATGKVIRAEPKTDAVEHPAHYNHLPNGIECIDVVKHFDFLLGNVIKYAWRAGHKPGADKLQDLRKMLVYAQFAVDAEIERRASAGE